MKTTFVLVTLICSLLFVSPAEAGKPVKSSCFELVYHNQFIKRNLGKMKGVKGRTNNHDHNKRFLGKLKGVQGWTTNFRKENW